MFQEPDLIPSKPGGPKQDNNQAYVYSYTQLYNSTHTKDFQDVFQNSKTSVTVAKLTQTLSCSLLQLFTGHTLTPSSISDFPIGINFLKFCIFCKFCY